MRRLKVAIMMLMMIVVLQKAVAQQDNELQTLTDIAYTHLDSASGLEKARQLFSEAVKRDNLKYQAKAKVIEAKYELTRCTADEYQDMVRPIMQWLREKGCLDDYYHVWIYGILEYSKEGKYLEANNLTNDMYEQAVMDGSEYGQQGAFRMKGTLNKARLAYAQALQCYYQELDFAKRSGSNTLFACYYNIGVCEAMEGKLQQARKSCSEGRKYASKPNVLAAFDVLQAFIATMEGRMKEVDSLCNVTKSKAYMLDDEVGEMWHYVSICQQWEKGRHSESLKDISEMSQKRQKQIMPAYWLSQKKYKEAYQARRELDLYADSISASFAALDMGQFTQRLKEQKLSKDNQQMRAMSIKMYCIIALLLMGTLLMVLLWRNAHQKRQAKFLKAERDAKNQFIREMSHEIRTPLHQISGFSQLLVEKHDELSESEKAEIAKTIEQSSNQLAELLNNVLKQYNNKSWNGSKE